MSVSKATAIFTLTKLDYNLYNTYFNSSIINHFSRLSIEKKTFFVLKKTFSFSDISSSY